MDENRTELDVEVPAAIRAIDRLLGRSLPVADYQVLERARVLLERELTGRRGPREDVEA